ncbi:hypothetical protein DRO69_00545 [Candidatus Bathyarchaeota archaeon]|nr:MAG: hypothetical protein DRO69_00545 [Candidatus Bathyarchaeota archaeon]
MFKFVRKTWNPVVGCTHNCTYSCWARRMAKRQKHRCQLCYEFVPHLHEERLNVFVPRRPTLCFVCDMGDLFCDGVPDEWIERVLNVARRCRNVIFLFLTKNPARYFDFLDLFPENSILGCTIETNRSYAVSLAPPVGERYIAMRDLKWPRKFIAVEPILDFDWVFLDWLKQIKPIMVSVGYNNYTKRFPEPDVEKTLTLIKELKKFTNVEIKTIRGSAARHEKRRL